MCYHLVNIRTKVTPPDLLIPCCNSFRCFACSVIKRTFIEQIFIEHPLCARLFFSLSGYSNDTQYTCSDRFNFLQAASFMCRKVLVMPCEGLEFLK